MNASDTVIAAVVADLRAQGSPARAERERAYLKSDLAHWGVRVPAIRAVATRASRGLDRTTLLAVAQGLWSVPVHERRAAAAFILAARTDLLDVRDADLLEQLLRECRTWALVDVIAPRVVGPLRVRQTADWRPVLERWIRDDDFWLRRSVLLTYLVHRGDPDDFAEFTQYAEPLLDDREFFVAKAIGWVLRDTGRRQPDMVAAWARPRLGRMRAVTRREVLKVISE